MEEYANNSNKSREKSGDSEKKKLDKVITGTAKTKKKNEIQRFKDVLISEDANNVKSYILLDVLIPALKKAISDIVTNGIDMILYGESGRTRKNNSTSRVSYSSCYRPENNRRDSYSAARRGGFDYDNIIFETRGDAESVLDTMNEIISKYGLISILDLYDLADISTSNYMLDKYGWTDISGATPVRVRDGYVLKLPKAVPLK